MRKPKISIIVPYKNAEPWIARCADSLKAQEGDHEFIFVNDHSTDGSLEELLEHTDDRFVLLENAPGHKGVSSARNQGIEAATGEWITLLDADDEMLAGALKVYEDLTDLGADICQEDHIRYYASKGTAVKMYSNAPGIYALDNLPLAWFGVWNKLYKRELLDGIKFDEEMKYGEDEIFNLECLNKARSIYHGGNITVKHNIENPYSLSHSRKAEDLIRQIKKLAEFLETHEDPDIRRVAYNTLTIHLGSQWYWDEICK